MSNKRFRYENVPLYLMITTIGMTIIGIIFSHDFREIITKPDNIPIAGMLLVVEFFTYLSFKQAARNDDYSRAGERHKIYEDMIQ